MPPKMKITLEGPQGTGKSIFAWFIIEKALESGFDIKLYDASDTITSRASRRKNSTGPKRSLEIRCLQTGANMSDTLAELFSRDPLKYSEQDLETIIAEYQEKRQLFMATGKAPTATKRPVDLAGLGLL